MKKVLFFIFIVLPLFACFAQPWQKLPDFPAAARDDAASFTISTNVYIGTGLTSWFAPTRDFRVFNTFTETWDSIKSMPLGQERQYACGFASATKGYIFGGLHGTQYLNDLWEYDPQQNSWAQKTRLPDLGRAGASCFVLGNIAYIIGGKTDSTDATNQVWAYDLTADTWLQKNNFPTGGSWRACATTAQNNGYLLFGKNENGAFSSQLYQYNAQADSWLPLAAFPLAGRTYASLTGQGGFLYAAMGADSLGSFYNDLWRFALQPQQWTKLDTLPALPRRGGVAFLNGSNTLAYTTGVNNAGTRLNETWKYALPIGLAENTLATIVVFPNPASDFITLQLPEKCLADAINVNIINAQGTLTLSTNVTQATTRIDIKQLPTGTYILQLFTADFTFAKQLIKL